MEKESKIYVAGHRGLVGSAIVRRLEKEGYRNLIMKTRQELDLFDQYAVQAFFENEKPEYVFLAAAKVGGIMANKTHKADFIYENLQIQNNIIRSAYEAGVEKLLFLGSSCIYPRECPQPIKEEYLLTSPLEKTNDSYSLAKIAGIHMCQGFNEQYGTNFISVMPTNIYGENDNFDLESGHVIPAMIRKFHEAKIDNKPVTFWGTGAIRREFLHVDDLADALLFLMQRYNDSEIINIGTGEDISIKELAELMQNLIGYRGEVGWDVSKPDGVFRKRLDVRKLHALGWQHKTALEDGLKMTYEWYQNHHE